MIKLITILFFLFFSHISSADPIKLIMHDGATISVITKHLNMPVVPIIVDAKDGNPLLRLGISTPNSLIFAGPNQFVDQALLSSPDDDILNLLTPIALISKSSITLATSSKTNNTLNDIVNNSRKNNRSIKMGGGGFNNICHFLSGYLTKEYNINFEYIEYSKSTQMDVDLYNQLIDVSCKKGIDIEDPNKRKYYNIIANFSKTDRTGSLKNVPVFDNLPDITTYYILFGNTSEHDTKLIIDSLKKAGENDWLTNNHVFLDINTNQDTILSIIHKKRLQTYDLIKSDPTFKNKIKTIPQ